MHVKCGSACSRTSCSQERAFTKAAYVRAYVRAVFLPDKLRFAYFAAK